MSVATHLAELEAAIAENELEETAAERLRELVQEGSPIPDALELVLAERDGAAPPPPLPEPAAAPTGDPTEKQLRELDREQTRHLEKARTIMGPFLEGFGECEKCDGLGLTPPGPTPQGHEWFIPCPTCNGFGEVYTGSLRSGRESRDCPACGGAGYLEALDANGVSLAEGGNAGPARPASLPPEPSADLLEQAPAPTPAPRHGRPAWMGDPAIGA